MMAMIVLALIRGGVALFGGSQGTDVNDTNNFAAFGVDAWSALACMISSAGMEQP